MKRALLLAMISFAIINPVISQTFTKSFDAADPLSEWSGDKDSWTVVNTSLLGGEATNSKTLKLNATGGSGQKYLSIQNTVPWGEEQSWSFWIGRGDQQFTSSNAVQIWLWADNANFQASNINGYRINIGNSNADDIVLEKVVNGTASTILSGIEYIPDDIKNFGIGLRITRNKNSIWTIYATPKPVSEGGVNANAPTSDDDINNFVNTSIYFKYDDTFTNFSNGFLGITAIHASSIAARQGLEFDNLQFKNSLNYNEYTWNGSVNNQFNLAENWSPARNSKSITDVLKFNSSASVEGLTDERISSVQILNNSNIILNNSSPTTLFLLGGSYKGLYLDEFSYLKILSSQNLGLDLQKGARAQIKGTIEFSKVATEAVNHGLFAHEQGAIEVNGNFIQNCNGNIFGSSGVSNIATFESGSSFISNNGANPFGFDAPNSKVVFKSGSRFIYRQSLPFSIVGRTFSNVEIDASGSINLSIGGISPMICDDFTVIKGNIIVKNTSSDIQLNLNGNLNITNGSLQLIPSGEGKALLNMQGDGKIIAGADKIAIGQNSTLRISNNTTLNNDLSISGTLNLFSGTLDLNSHSLAFADDASIQKVGGSLSAAPQNNANLNYIYGDGTTSPVVGSGIELLPEVKSLTVNNSNGFTLNRSVSINQSLTFEKGSVFSDESNFITLKSTASVFNVGDNRYNDGPIARETNSTAVFLFPVGKDEKYRPLGIIPSTSSISVFKANYSNTGYNSYELAPELKEISKKEWWNLQKTSGSAKTKVQLAWNNESGINEANLPNLRIGRFDGSFWQNEGVEFTEGESYIISDELEEFGPITFAGVNESVFPVEFFSFEGEANTGFSLLKWVTTLENNNSGFEVEKSSNGIDFVKIGFVNPLPFAENGKRIYEFKDYNFFSSGYYRIKQVDLNGERSFSKVIFVEKKGFQSAFIKPNPSYGNVTLVGLPSDQVMELKVSSLEGVSLINLKGDLSMINEKLNFFLSSNPIGGYFIVIRSKDRVQSLKFFKQ
jgi:hypothetical protein